MGFRAVFRKTLVDLTGWRSALLLMVLPVALATGIQYWAWHTEGDWPLQMATYYATNQLLVTSFYWLSGFLVALLVAANAAGLIAREQTDGTLLILASKPVSRQDILLGKLAALVVRSLLLETILLLLLSLLWRFTLGLEEDTFVALLRAILWILPYSLLVIVFFGAVSMALSALTRSLVGITVIMSCLVIFSFLVGPLVRDVSAAGSDAYVRNHLYYVDISYHIQNAFVLFEEQASGGRIVPEFSGWFGSEGILPSYTHQWAVGGYYPVDPLAYVSPGASTAVLLVISAAAVGLALYAMDRKEIS